MAMYRPTEPENSKHNQALQTLEICFLILFTIEISVKLVVLDMRFFADGWNVLDLIIVST